MYRNGPSSSPKMPAAVGITPTVFRSMPTRWKGGANLRIAPTAIRNRLVPMVIATGDRPPRGPRKAQMRRQQSPGRMIALASCAELLDDRGEELGRGREEKTRLSGSPA